MAQSGKRTLTPKEKHIIGTLILEHCHPIPGKIEYARWEADIASDVGAADKLRPIIPSITVYHVRYLRQEFGLHLEHISSTKGNETRRVINSLEDRIHALEDRVRALEEAHTSPK